ncbi:hypothetical protein C8Q77DRAFT_1076647 [Trametes polyzona]|nr:hypothetical protein C8Q77DRAFT_1076647 [Trametes polyzona]
MPMEEVNTRGQDPSEAGLADQTRVSPSYLEQREASPLSVIRSDSEAPDREGVPSSSRQIGRPRSGTLTTSHPPSIESGEVDPRALQLAADGLEQSVHVAAKGTTTDDLPMNVDADVSGPADICAHNQGELPDNVSPLTDVFSGIRPDVRDISPNVRPDVRPDVHSDTSPNVRPDVRPDVRSDISPNVRPDVHSDISPDVRPDVRSDISPNVRPNVCPDVRPDVHSDISPEVRPDVHPNVSPNVHSDVQVDVRTDGASGVHTGLASGVQAKANNRNGVNTDVYTDAHADVRTDVRSVAQTDVHTERSADVSTSTQSDNTIPTDSSSNTFADDFLEARNTSPLNVNAPTTITPNAPSNIGSRDLRTPVDLQRRPDATGAQPLPSPQGLSHDHVRFVPGIPASGPDVLSDAYTSLSKNAAVHAPPVQANTASGTQTCVAPDKRFHVTSNDHPDVPSDARTLHDSNLCATATSDSGTNVALDLCANTPSDPHTNSASDVRPHVAPDVHMNEPPNLPINIDLDLRTAIAPDACANPTLAFFSSVPPHVRVNAPPDLRMKTALDLPHGVDAISEDGNVVGDDDFPSQYSANLPSGARASQDDVPHVTNDQAWDSRARHLSQPQRTSGRGHDNSGRGTDRATGRGEHTVSQTVFEDDFVEDAWEDSGNEETDPAGPVVGRISNENKRLLGEAYKEVVQKAQETSTATGLSVTQVFDRWFRACTRAHVKDNHWNIYASYFVQYMDQELARLPPGFSDAPGFVRNCAATRRVTYAAFNKMHGLNAHTILQKFRMLQEIRLGQTHTVAQRRTEFNKSVKKLKEMLSSFQDIHGFSSVCALVGNVVNSDVSLAMIHETQDAQGFFEERCRTDHDGVISHLKAHIYNNVSLGHIDLAFTAQAEETDTHRSAGVPSQKKPIAATSLRGVRAGDRGKGHEQRDHEDDEDEDEDDGAVEDAEDEIDNGVDGGKYGIEDHGLEIPPKLRPDFITGRFRPNLGKHTILSGRMFPLKAFVSKLAQGGVIICNWPDEIPLPPRPRKRGSKLPNEPNTYTKGASGIPSQVQDSLVAGMRDPENPLHLKLYSGRIADLLGSKVPVLRGSPPASSSRHTHGRRLFYNGTEDRKGSPRLQPSTQPETLPSADSVSGDLPVDAAATPAEHDDRPRKAKMARFRPVEVLISTSPKKRVASTNYPPEVFEVSSGEDSDSDFVLSEDQAAKVDGAKGPRGTKRKPRQQSITLVSSDSEADLPQMRRAYTNTSKGKGRAPDVGMRSPSPPVPPRLPVRPLQGGDARPTAPVVSADQSQSVIGTVHVPAGVYRDIPSNVCPDAHSDVRTDIPSDIRPDVSPDVQMDIGPDAHTDISTNVRPVVPSAIHPIVPLQAPLDLPLEFPSGVPFDDRPVVDTINRSSEIRSRLPMGILGNADTVSLRSSLILPRARKITARRLICTRVWILPTSDTWRPIALLKYFRMTTLRTVPTNKWTPAWPIEVSHRNLGLIYSQPDIRGAYASSYNIPTDALSPQWQGPPLYTQHRDYATRTLRSPAPELVRDGGYIMPDQHQSAIDNRDPRGLMRGDFRRQFSRHISMSDSNMPGPELQRWDGGVYEMHGGYTYYPSQSHTHRLQGSHQPLPPPDQYRAAGTYAMYPPPGYYPHPAAAAAGYHVPFPEPPHSQAQVRHPQGAPWPEHASRLAVPAQYHRPTSAGSNSGPLLAIPGHPPAPPPAPAPKGQDGSAAPQGNLVP